MKISDYNQVARFYGRKEYSLNANEYLVVADFSSMVKIRNLALENQEKIHLFGHTLTPKYSICQDGFLEMSSNHINTGIFLVSDQVIKEEYLYQNHLIGNYKTTDKNEIKKIENHINQLDNDAKANTYLLPSASTKLAIQEATVGLTAMVTFIGLYLGMIFLISSAAILGLKELSESSDNKERFKILRKIGADEKLIHQALFRQIAIFFALPLLLALIHSIFGILFAVKVLEVFGTEELLPSIVATALLLVVIYGGYFFITYFCSKNIIKEE